MIKFNLKYFILSLFALIFFFGCLFFRMSLKYDPNFKNEYLGICVEIRDLMNDNMGSNEAKIMDNIKNASYSLKLSELKDKYIKFSDHYYVIVNTEKLLNDFIDNGYDNIKDEYNYQFIMTLYNDVSDNITSYKNISTFSYVLLIISLPLLLSYIGLCIVDKKKINK